MSRRGVIVDASYCGALVAFVVASAAVIAHNAFAHRWTSSFASSVVLPSSLALSERWWSSSSTDDVVRRRAVFRAALALSCAGPGWVAAAAVACGDGRSDVVPWSRGDLINDNDGATEPTPKSTMEGWPPLARAWYESATSNDGYEDELGGPTCARLGDALFFAGSDGADDGRRRLFAQSLAKTTTTTTPRPRSFGTFSDPTGLTVVSSTAKDDGDRRWLCFFDASRALWCGDDGREPRSFWSATLPAAARSAARPTAIEGELWWRGADDAAYSYRPDERELVVREMAGASGRLSCRARDRWACATLLVACALPVALVGSRRGRREPSAGVVGSVAAAVATTAIAGVVEPRRAPDAWFLVWDVGAPLAVAASTVASLSRDARDRRDADAGWWWTLAFSAAVLSARAVVAVAVELEDLRRHGRYDVGDLARDSGRAAVVASGVGAALSVVGRLVDSALVSFLATTVVGSFVAHAAVAVSWRTLVRAGASSATRGAVVAVVVAAAASALSARTRRRRDDPRWRDAAIALWERWTEESGARYDPDAVERLVPTEDDGEDKDKDDECSTAPATLPTSSVELT